MRHAFLTALLLTIAAPAAAQGSCPARLGVDFGDTLSSIARSCGVNVEALMRVNPGLTPETLRAGTAINVPRPALPSPQQRVGRPSVPTMPSMVPPGTGAPSIGGVPSTVILPPVVPPVPQQHILPGIGDPLPGQISPPPGHVVVPGNTFPYQRN